MNEISVDTTCKNFDKKKKKIGIMGGTFNPIHNAHIELAKAAFVQHSLDKIWFMVSPTPPHKINQNIVDIYHRNNMVKLAIEQYDYFEFSDFEQKREGYIYTADTLLLLKDMYPECEFYFIVGGDSIKSIEKWYHPEIILSNCVMLAAKRDDLSDDELNNIIANINNKFNADVRIVNLDRMDISSTNIRMGNFDNVPDRVKQYIIDNNLYEFENIIK